MIKKGFSILGIGLLYLISLLPFFILYTIADLLYHILYYVMRYRLAVVRLNLLNSFPEKSDFERRLIEKEYYRYLADLIVETVKLFSISKKELQKRFTSSNFDEIVGSRFAQGKSIIGVVGHYGNWEMGALKLGMLTHERQLIVYKPLNNDRFNKAFEKMRSRFGAIMIPMKNTLRTLVDYRKQLSICLLVSDQTPTRHDTQYFTSFLNQSTAVFLGIEKLARTLDNAVVFCDITVVKRGYYNVNFVPLFDDPKSAADHEITNVHVQYLENKIKEMPQYWLWSHRRWKFKPEDIN